MGANAWHGRLRRYERPLLVDPRLQEQLHQAGYAVLDPVLSLDEIEALQAIGESFLERLDEPWGELFLGLGRVQSAALREEVIAAAGAIVAPRLATLFVDGTEILASAFQVKPPSPASSLDPHQDSSLLDESAWLGVYAWIPLVDTDEENGWLCVVPGSHRLGNEQRSLNLPWQFDGLTEVMRRHGRCLRVPAGGVVLFDAALIHYSPPNASDRVRLAANAFAKPPDAPLVHYYLDHDTPAGRVELYEIDLSFFTSQDIMARPTDPYRLLEVRDQIVFDLDEHEFDARCAALAPGRPPAVSS